MNGIINFLPLVLATLIFLAWPWISSFFPNMKIEQMMATLVGLFTGTTLYIWSLARNLKTSLATISENTSFLRHDGISRQSLSAAIDTALKHRRVVNKLRIFAISSGQIQPIFATSSFNVNHCIIALRSFSGLKSAAKDKEFSVHINQIASEWKRMKDTGKISELDILRYNFMPTEYFCIFDDAVMIFGGYSFDSTNWSRVDVLDPFIVLADSDDRKILIKSYIEKFDSMASAFISEFGSN